MQKGALQLRMWQSCFVKEWSMEWRNASTTAAALLFVSAAVYLIYATLLAGRAQVSPVLWVTLFWLVVLFSAVMASTKSFVQEEKGLFFSVFQLYSPLAIIAAKLTMQIVLQSLLSIGAWLLLMLLIPVKGSPDWVAFLWVLGSGASGLSITLTMVSAIAIRAENAAALVPVLGLPLLIPQAVMIVKASIIPLQGLDSSLIMDELAVLWSLNIIAVSLSLVLFAYLWRR